MSWSPDGDRLAYFVRTEKSRTLILQNILTRRRSSSGSTCGWSTTRNRLTSRPTAAASSSRPCRAAPATSSSSISSRKEVTNVTKDEFADYAPDLVAGRAARSSTSRASARTRSCSASIWTPARKTQITFGTHDDGTAKFLDADTLVFASTATDPTKPIDPEVARNGNIYNIWTLGLKTGELRQYTDAVGGNLYAVAVNDGGERTRIGFVSYYKASYELHTLERREPIIKAASADFGEPGAIIPFQAPLSHTLIADNKKKKGTFEKLFLDGRPPVNVGVTSGGDIFGGSSVTFSDVLGDQQFNLYAASISQYRTLSFSYLNLARRFNYALQGVLADDVLLRQSRERPLRPVVHRRSRLSRWRRAPIRGGTVFGIWPFNRYRRAELFGGFMQYHEQFNDPSLAGSRRPVTRRSSSDGSCSAAATSSRSASTSSRRRRCSASSVRLPGRTMRLGYEVRAEAGRRHAVAADRRRRRPLLPPHGQQRTAGASGARLPQLGRCSRTSSTSAATPKCTATSTWSSSAIASGFVNAELRFPLIEAMLTPLGVLGGIRGVLFANMGGWQLRRNDRSRDERAQPFKWAAKGRRSLHADHRLRPDQCVSAGADLRRADGRQGAATG